MKRVLPARLCYYLLLACIPASMLLAVWLAPNWHTWMQENALGLYRYLYAHVYPMMPSWAQYFAVQTLVALMALCGALYLAGSERWARWPGWSWRCLFPSLVVGYGAWAGLTYYWSAWPYATRAYVLREAPFYFLCVAAVYLCARPRRWLTLARVFMVAAFLEAVLQGSIIIHFAHVEGWTLRKAFVEKAVLFSNPNFGCSIMLTAALIAVAFLALEVRRMRGPAAGRRPTWHGMVRIAALVAALCAYGFIVWTANALAAYLAAGVAACAYALCLLPIRHKGALVGTAGAVAVALVVAVLASETLWTRSLRWALSPRRTTHLRVVDWVAGAELYVRRPLHGWGMGTFPATCARFHIPLAHKLPYVRGLRTTHPHNEFVRIASEQGLVGLLLYVTILGFAFTVSYRGLRTAPLRLRVVGYALWAGTLAFVVQGCFGKAPMNWSFSTNYWLLLGVLASASHWLGARPKPSPRAEPLRITAAGAVTLLVVGVLVGWWWWQWARGAYDSKVHLNHSRVARYAMAKDEAEEEFAALQESLELARPRCLWPDEILHIEYGIGLFLHRHERWARAARQWERVQSIAPEFLKTRLYLAQAYRHLGRRLDAAAQLEEFLRRNPYELQAYGELTRLAGRQTTMLALEERIFSRLRQEEGWIAEDYPSAEEVHALLNTYVELDQWQRARTMILAVKGFFDRIEAAEPVDAFAVVRGLERRYRQPEKEEQARQLREAIPEAWESP
jgi:tetratricopeptide (TPR) repeat protein/O-antigen ligase